ncbi:hypothetical protein [Pricia sp.]
MKTKKIGVKPKKVKKSFLESIHSYLKRYADNCRYSFEGMLRI